MIVTMASRRFSAGLALAAMAIGLLAPVAGMAARAAKSVPTVICGPGGVQVIHVPGDPAPLTGTAHEHCALCVAPLELAAPQSPVVRIDDSPPLVFAMEAARAAPPAHPYLHPPSHAPPPFSRA